MHAVFARMGRAHIVKPCHAGALALVGWLFASPAMAMNCEKDSLSH
jgi:hypothetical protein